MAADDAETVARSAPPAAREAAAASSHRQALALFEAALRHGDRLADDERARVVEGYAWELSTAYRFDDAVAAGREAVSRYEHLDDPVALGTAIRDYLVQFGAELHSHHSREDDVAWPVIRASAGTAVDLAPLTEDHTALAPLIDAMVATARAFAADPAAHLASLAASMRELSDLLHEHIPDEERDVLPVVSRYVSVPDWEAVERRMRAGLDLRHLAWVLPWIARLAAPQQLAHVLAKGGPVFRLLLALTRGRYRRREQLIFGSDPARYHP